MEFESAVAIRRRKSRYNPHELLQLPHLQNRSNRYGSPFTDLLACMWSLCCTDSCSLGLRSCSSVALALRKGFLHPYFHDPRRASIFGDPDRVAVRRSKWRIFAMYAWKSGLYLLPEFQILTNYLTWNNDVYLAPELGYSHKRSTLYVKPGIGIAPGKNDRQWGLEFGGRFQF